MRVQVEIATLIPIKKLHTHVLALLIAHVLLISSDASVTYVLTLGGSRTNAAWT